jgi:uncharacterized protein YdcH (DUF465 family)
MGRQGAKEARMDRETLIERLTAENEEFRHLRHEHHEHDHELEQLKGIAPLGESAVADGELKKLKLMAKDRMESIIRHSASAPDDRRLYPGRGRARAPRPVPPLPARDARMVDVSAKAETVREAVARGVLRMTPATLRVIREGNAPKG